MNGYPNQALREELELLEAETFEVQDYTDVADDFAATSTTSCTSSCTSTSSTSCCG
ncbi:thiazolylpeptide-type bacteriocin [Microbispora sp. NPDC088329]|uniref:thiazolylpeptide-type bacteriocin n=1 Tax=unclassified Microbispora TaxID=2614687 RepID=UPI0034196AF7